MLGATGDTPTDIDENWLLPATATSISTSPVPNGDESISVLREASSPAPPAAASPSPSAGRLLARRWCSARVGGLALDAFDSSILWQRRLHRECRPPWHNHRYRQGGFGPRRHRCDYHHCHHCRRSREDQPGTDISGPFVVTGSTGDFNNLQGTFGFFVSTNGHFGLFGIAGTATITGGATEDDIWDTGGAETINVNNVHTKVFVDQLLVDSEAAFPFVITDEFGEMDNNNGAGPKTAVINDFTPGFNGTSNTSWVDFNTNSWGIGYTGLVNGTGSRISTEGSHFASFSVIAGTGNFDVSDVVAYEIGGTYGSAAAVAKAIVSSGGSFIDGILASAGTFDLLVAYANKSGGTNIADIQLGQNFNFTTFGATIENTADLVTLSGVGLTKIIGSVLGSNDVVHFNGASPA